MSSSFPKPELYRLVVHPAVSVSVSTTTVLAGVLLLSRMAGSGPAAITIAAVILAPLVEASVGNLLFQERAGLGNRARELVIYVLLVYAAASMLRPARLVDRFVPSPDQLVPVAASAVAWFQAFGIHTRMRGREGLLRRFGGKSGTELRHALVERQHDMALTVRELKAMRAAILSSTVLIGSLATAAALVPGVGLPIGSAAFAAVFLNVVAALVSLALTHGFIDEYEANGAGLSVPYTYQRRRLVVAALLVGLTGIGALLLSRPGDLLPFERIVAFFRWLISLFEPRESDPISLEFPRQVNNPMGFELLRRQLLAREEVVAPLWMRMFAVMLRRLAIAIGVATGIALVFGPLLSRDFRNGVSKLSLQRILRNLSRRFRRRFVILVRWLRSRRRAKPDRAPEPVQVVETVSDSGRIGWRPGVMKRRQMDRAVAVFLTIAGWGAARGVSYHRSLGAQEYLAELAAVVPKCSEDLQFCRQVFWLARYSRIYVTRKRMRAFIAAAKRVTATG